MVTEEGINTITGTLDVSSGTLTPPGTLVTTSAGPPAAASCLSAYEIIVDTTNHIGYFCDAVGGNPIDMATQGDAVTEVDTDDAVAVIASGAMAVGIGGADASITSEGNNTNKTVKLRAKALTHATDCTTNVTAKIGELCVDLDDYKLWICVPTSGDCDTAGEWHQIP